MKKCFIWVFSFLFFFSSLTFAAIPKKWTMLIFMNGNNNLFYDAEKNLIEMEQVGSSDQVNVVVEWADLYSKNAVRLLVKKSQDKTRVTSPILEKLGQVDMGDVRTLENFIDWGVKYFPAEHYFVIVWDHGTGWHLHDGKEHYPPALDISRDEITGHKITTLQLAKAMTHAAKIMGHQVDLYGSDACLMAMLEVADEMSDAVHYFVGSEETEPSSGWDYQAFLKQFIAEPDMPIRQMADILVTSYIKKCQKHYDDATLSAFDLSKLNFLRQAMKRLSNSIVELSKEDKAKVLNAIKKSQSFDFDDYVDIADFLKELDLSNTTLPQSVLHEARERTLGALIAHKNTMRYRKARGMSLWMPKNKRDLEIYSKRYKELKFNKETHWIDALSAIHKGSWRFTS